MVRLAILYKLCSSKCLRVQCISLGDLLEDGSRSFRLVLRDSLKRTPIISDISTLIPNSKCLRRQTATSISSASKSFCTTLPNCHKVEVNMLACKLSIYHSGGNNFVLIHLGNLVLLLKSWQHTKYSAHIPVTDLAMVMFYINKRWFIAVVECSGTKPSIVIKGDGMDERGHAVEGFMTKVESLLWAYIGTAALIE